MILPDRVRVIHATPPLPIDIAAALAGRARWLRRDVPALDRDLGFACPPIEVRPVCWIHTLGDGTSGIVPGRVALHPVPGSQDAPVFVVEIAAAALLTYDDDLLRGVLVHEVLHVVHHTLALARAAAAGASRLDLAPEGDEYFASRTAYRFHDAQKRANPDRWLTAPLCRVLALAEAENRFGDGTEEAIVQRWVARDLPVEPPVADLHAGQVLLDRAIVDRARQLGEGDEEA